MSQQIKRLLCIVLVVCAVSHVPAFSLLGPYAAWQIPRIGYNPLNTDIGGVMNLGEEYRWNTPTVYYAYDESFLNYFGAAGTNSVDKAFAILNALPKYSQMSSNLAEFPTDAKRVNYTAEAMGLMDLKSITLTIMMEETGLASPERYTWTLRDRRVISGVTNYTVFKRNFDPVTLAPSSFVNGALYTFVILEFINPDWADAVEVQLDPLVPGFTAVASGIDGLFSFLGFGEYYTGLTRDDVGGLRYLYRTNNIQNENVVAGTTGTTSGSPWAPVGGTNAPVVNAIADLALRPGLDKINFVKGRYDSLVGSFIAITNTSTDYYVSNGVVRSQTIQRVITQPDILLTAEDLDLDSGGAPIFVRRTDTGGWANNDALNGQATLDGPGVIQPSITISYSKVGPYFFNLAPAFLDDLIAPLGGFVWGSFDGSTNAPIIFPDGTSIFELEQQIFYGGGGGSEGSAWAIPNSLVVTTNAVAQ